jgi:hypothetical protein
MRPVICHVAAVFVFSFSFCFAQTTPVTSAAESPVKVSVPRLIRLSGTLSNADGQARTVGVTLAIYKDEQGGAALWQEVQNVKLDGAGRYTVLLGSSTNEGLPLDLFSSGEARWLGIRVDQDQEQMRTLLVAVPYALKAADAEALGGKPASSFVTTEQLSSNFSSPSGPTQRVQTAVVSGGTPLGANVTGSGSQNSIPKFDSSGTNLINSLLLDDGTHVGLGTQSPTFEFDEQNSDASAAGSNMFRIQTPSVNGATMHFISTSANGRHFGFGSNFILGNGEFGIYDYTANANRLLIDAKGNIGIGTSTPQFNFDLQNADATAAGSNIFRLRTPSANGAVMHFQSTSANGHDWAFGSNFIVGNGEFGVYDYTANASRFFITAAGNIGIGTTAPSAALDVAGNLKVRSGGITFPDNTVQSTAATGGGSGTITGITTDANSGLTGGGTSGTLSLSLLTSCAPSQILKWSGTAWACGADQTGAGGIVYPYSSGNQSTSSGAFTVTQTNSVVLGNGTTFQQAMTSIPAAIVGVASTTSNSAVGVAGFSNSIGSPGVVGWNGSTTGSNDSAPGIIGQSDNPNGTAIEGTASSATGNTRGVRGKVNSPNGTAIQGDANGGGMAGVFNGQVQVNGGLQVGSNITGGNGTPVSVSGGMSVQGNLQVTGVITAGTKDFKIDHPLDPEHKYLFHASVESPEMKNVYDGVTSLDKQGRAWVELPGYFEALNQDFRYQLTAVGAPAQLYIAKEVRGNRFLIAGGKPDGKVSWQVTGIRRDAYAQTHPMQVEADKPAEEQGHYLYPEAYRQAQEKGVASVGERKLKIAR